MLSQSKLDLLLGGPGFYIEAGANDGVTQSNTIELEKRGWTGLLVEPNKFRMQECKASRNNLSNKFEQCALVAFTHHGGVVRGNFDEPGLTESLTGQATTVLEYWDQFQTAAAEEKQQRKLIDVPAVTLQSLVDKYGIKRIRYLSLDVEGYEYEAMNGLDFNRNPPTVIRVETSKKPYRIKAMTEYLVGKGYNFVGTIESDCVYRIKE